MKAPARATIRLVAIYIFVFIITARGRLITKHGVTRAKKKTHRRCPGVIVSTESSSNVISRLCTRGRCIKLRTTLATKSAYTRDREYRLRAVAYT